MRFFWDVWLKITQTVCDKKLVCFSLKNFLVMLALLNSLTCPPFSRLPSAKLTKEKITEEKKPSHSPPLAFCILSKTDWLKPNVKGLGSIALF